MKRWIPDTDDTFTADPEGPWVRFTEADAEIARLTAIAADAKKDLWAALEVLRDAELFVRIASERGSEDAWELLARVQRALK